MGTGRIFINYRRDDSRADSGRIYDYLSARFPGKVFRDVGSLEPGVDWQQAIGKVLSQSDACVVVIGCNWLNIKGDDGTRRLDDPNDTVRREVFAALQRNMRIFPVLVGGAKMPKPHELPPDLQPLCDRNALEITEQDWTECCAKLARGLETALALSQPAPSPPAVVAVNKSSGAKWFVALGLAALLVFGIVVALALKKPSETTQAANGNLPPVQQAPVSPLEVSPPSPLPVRPPQNQPAPKPRPQAVAPAPATPSSMFGNWAATVNVNGATLFETVELYGDQSFRVLLNGMSQAVGKWQSDPLGQVALTNGTNFVTGLHFSCGSRSNEDGANRVQGNCSDQANNVWSFSMTRAAGVLPIAVVPRVNLSQLSLGERAAFIQLLNTLPCTCRCGMTVYMCLEKDPTCNYSPAIANNALARFLRTVRG